MKVLHLVLAVNLYACRTGVAAHVTGSPIELDLVFPNPNVTYALDSQASYMPFVFAWQGFGPAIMNNSLDFFFDYSIQNLNATGPNKGGWNNINYFNTTYADEISNTDGSPAFYVNTIPFNNNNVSDIIIVEGIVNYFLMEIYLNWGNASLASCFSDYVLYCSRGCQLQTTTTFALWGGSPDQAPKDVSVVGSADDMPGVANVCPEPLLYQGWNATATTVCDTYTEPQSNPTPCAAKPDAAAVRSFSSVALAELARYPSVFGSAAVTQTSSAHISGTPQSGTAASAISSTAPKTFLSSPSSSSSHSNAMVTAMPYTAAPLLVGVGVLGGMHLCL